MLFGNFAKSAYSIIGRDDFNFIDPLHGICFTAVYGLYGQHTAFLSPDGRSSDLCKRLGGGKGKLCQIPDDATGGDCNYVCRSDHHHAYLYAGSGRDDRFLDRNVFRCEQYNRRYGCDRRDPSGDYRACRITDALHVLHQLPGMEATSGFGAVFKSFRYIFRGNFWKSLGHVLLIGIIVSVIEMAVMLPWLIPYFSMLFAIPYGISTDMLTTASSTLMFWTPLATAVSTVIGILLQTFTTPYMFEVYLNAKSVSDGKDSQGVMNTAPFNPYTNPAGNGGQTWQQPQQQTQQIPPAAAPTTPPEAQQQQNENNGNDQNNQ